MCIEDDRRPQPECQWERVDVVRDHRLGSSILEAIECRGMRWVAPVDVLVTAGKKPGETTCLPEQRALRSRESYEFAYGVSRRAEPGGDDLVAGPKSADLSVDTRIGRKVRKRNDEDARLR
jgi:hypothetical protein